ncbi:MAG: hypothetical protein RIT27_855 [Pseudomonadota bacterium]|jgi:hypothetical protein
MLLFSSKPQLKYTWLLLTFFMPFQAIASPSEYELKAAFLYNLGNFITWPAKAYSSEDAPFFLCILGNDPFGENLDLITNNQKIAGRSIQITRLSNEVDARGCQLVFISNSEQHKMSKILNTLKNYPVLTVGDTDDFIDQGGMIMFVTVDNKVKLTVFPERISNLSLKASAKLLQISKIIK